MKKNHRALLFLLMGVVLSGAAAWFNLSHLRTLPEEKEEADKIQLESDLNYFSGTQSFVGMMEMNSLYNEYKRTLGDEFNILEFHHLVLSDGIIPLYELKKQIFLP